MFHRGDLVLDKNSKYNIWNVYLLISANSDETDDHVYWWVHDLGILNYEYRWNKDLIVRVLLSKRYCLKLSLSDLSEEKQETYQKFKTNYLDKDLV